MKHYYLIGKTVIELSMPQDMLLPQTLSAFACVPTEPAQRYRLYFSDHLSDAEQQFRADGKYGNIVYSDKSVR